MRVLHRYSPTDALQDSIDKLVSYIRTEPVERIAWIAVGRDADGRPFSKIHIQQGAHQNALIAGTNDVLWHLMEQRWRKDE